MSALIDQLKKEHTTLATVLTGAMEAGLQSPECKKKLTSAKAMLLAHLAKEDKELYPKLMGNPELSVMARASAKEMEGISKVVLAYFDKFLSPTANANSADFTVETGKLIGALQMRIKKEETSLYVRYDELVGKN